MVISLTRSAAKSPHTFHSIIVETVVDAASDALFRNSYSLSINPNNFLAPERLIS